MATCRPLLSSAASITRLAIAKQSAERAQSILYDNTKIAVARILGDRTRVRTRRFTELQSHYLFDDKFGRPARGNDKGNVEGMVGYTRRNFMVPAPRYDSFDDLNAHLEAKCLARQGDTLRGHDMTIGKRLMSDLDALMGLPPSRDIALQCPAGQRSQNMKPAIMSVHGQPRSRWCGIAAMTTLYRWRIIHLSVLPKRTWPPPTTVNKTKACGQSLTLLPNCDFGMSFDLKVRDSNA